MQKKEIKVQIKKEGRAAKRSLRGFIKKGNQDKLHKFRVGIKKLRAIASMIEQTNARIGVSKALKPVRDTYKLSGKVRDSYLHLKLVKTVSGAHKKYRSREKLVMKKAGNKLSKYRSHHFRMLHRAWKSLLRSVPKVKDKKVNAFYETELRGIETCLISNTGVEQMHGCRKRLKVLIYNLPMVHGSLDKPLDEDYLQQMQTAIGDWHDHVLAADQFPELVDQSQQMLEKVKVLAGNFYALATRHKDELTNKRR